jgi:hypothetical protein
MERTSIMRTPLALTLAAAALSVSACAADGGYGGGLAFGYGYDSPYGFSCSPYGYGAYGYGGYGDCGWYDGFFYPGFGGFVFDRHHHRHEMTMRQHDYFTRQARGPNGQPRVGLGSSGGVVPPSISQPQPQLPRGGAAQAPRTGLGGFHGGSSRHVGGRHG